MRRLVKRVAGAPGQGLRRVNIPLLGYDPRTLKPIFGKKSVRTLMKLPNDGQGDPVPGITTTHGVLAGGSSEGASTRAVNPVAPSNRGQRVVKPPNPAGKGGRIGKRVS